MLFSSPAFFAFFAVYFLFHLITPRRYRNLLIIAGSTVFYAWWKAAYIWLPYLLMAIAYFGTLWVEAAQRQSARKSRLIIAIATLFAPLVVFKYADFLYDTVRTPVFGGSTKLVDLPLPLGVSFITFTLTAYIVDTYRGRFPGRPSPSSFMAYVLFFPHLIAGPILRPAELIPQFDRPRSIASSYGALGFVIFTCGLVKKIVFADQMAKVVDAIYGHPGIPSAPEAWLAIYGFSLQIYCDFSGYTDMAIGLALLIGVRLPTNFWRPYGAASLIEFWRRWHITLSFWLRDYLYIPLGGNRHGRLRSYRNIIITMALGGLWHGSNWTFMIWGLLHGIGVSVVHLWRQLFGEARPSALGRVAGVLITFHFVTIAWVFFRAPDFAKALEMLEGLICGSWRDLAPFVHANIAAIILLLIFLALHPFDDQRQIRFALSRVRPAVIWPLIVLLWALAMTISQGSTAKFIYFDF